MLIFNCDKVTTEQSHWRTYEQANFTVDVLGITEGCHNNESTCTYSFPLNKITH